jgi:hypothetical protein
VPAGTEPSIVDVNEEDDSDHVDEEYEEDVCGVRRSARKHAAHDGPEMFGCSSEDDDASEYDQTD